MDLTVWDLLLNCSDFFSVNLEKRGVLDSSVSPIGLSTTKLWSKLFSIRSLLQIGHKDIVVNFVTISQNCLTICNLFKLFTNLWSQIVVLFVKKSIQILYSIKLASLYIHYKYSYLKTLTNKILQYTLVLIMMINYTQLKLWYTIVYCFSKIPPYSILSYCSP